MKTTFKKLAAVALVAAAVMTLASGSEAFAQTGRGSFARALRAAPSLRAGPESLRAAKWGHGGGIYGRCHWLGGQFGFRKICVY